MKTRVRELRMERGMTVNALAEKSGVHFIYTAQ